MHRSNIIFIVADDHRFSALGCLHETWREQVHTPNLDSLAQSGAHFRCAHMESGDIGAVCVPARASLLTGNSRFVAQQYPPDMEYNGRINPDLQTLPQTFREADYDTFCVGKWHNDLASLRRSFARGKSVFIGGMDTHYGVPVCKFGPDDAIENLAISSDPTQHSSDLFGDTALDFLRENERGETPFFLYLAFTAPHDPYEPSEKWREFYAVREVELPPSFAPAPLEDNGALTVRDETIAPAPRTPETVAQMTRDYYALLSHMDEKIGELVAELERRNLRESTLIVYTADHGLAGGRHGLWGKQNTYDHSIRVPLIFNGPDVPVLKSDELVCSRDAFATVCDLAGLEIPASVRAPSLAPIFAGEASKRGFVFANYCDKSLAASDGRWKIMWITPDEATARAECWLLFDLENDVHETRDLARNAEFADVFSRLQAVLLAWHESDGDSRF